MTVVTDLSDDGTDPDPDGDGDPTEPGEEDPTLITGLTPVALQSFTIE